MNATNYGRRRQEFAGVRDWLKCDQTFGDTRSFDTTTRLRIIDVLAAAAQRQESHLQLTRTGLYRTASTL
jgi:hypothetical protein